jgi:hypothetical protein
LWLGADINLWKNVLNKKNAKIICMALFLSILLSISILHAGATASPVIAVVPQTITVEDPLPKPFIINVTIANVEEPGLYAYQFKLYYNNTILKGTEVVLPPDHFLTPTLSPGNIFVTELKVYHDLGYVSAAVTLMADEPGKTGSGTLATITFNATNVGSCTLDLRDIILVDSDMNDIPHDISDGNVTVVPEFPSLIMLLFILVTLAAAILVKNPWFKKRLNANVVKR